MGLIKALTGAVGGTLADQWKEYIYCDALPEDVLVAKGRKKTSGRSANRKGSDNVISNGSVIAINEGQCMIIVENGKVVDLCAEPGEYVYDCTTEPSIFSGELSNAIETVFASIGKRFAYGGEVPQDQRVYFFNTKEIVGNKYGTPNPVPFRVVDQNIGLDIDIAIRCFGEYSYRVTNPILFYSNVCGNVVNYFSKDEIESQLKSELLTALQPAFARISAMGIRYSSLPAHTFEMAEAMNTVLSGKWRELRGIEIVSFAVASVKASEEDEAMIKELQRTAVFRNPTMAAAHLAGAQADAMKAAASNTAGAMTGFMGMNMAQNAGGMNTQALYQMGNQQQMYNQMPQNQPVYNQAPQNQPVPAQNAASAATTWTCSCGSVNKGKFCPECGSKKPQYRCDKCGWEPENPAQPPKFCPECGDRFDSDDIE